MISRLELESFGKFRGESFDLSPVTVFYGPNEAGKSTLFDALSLSLCGPNGLKEGKRNRRYGKACLASARDGTGAELEERMDPVEFFSFYAIGSEKIEVPMAKDGVWLDRLRHSLFSGGINPQVLAEELRKRLDSTKRANEEAKAARELASAREREAEVRTRIAAVERSRVEARAAAGEMASLSAEVERLTASAEGLALRQKRVMDAHRLHDAAALLDRLSPLLSEPSWRPAPDESASLAKLQEGLRAASRATGDSQAKLRLRREAASGLEARLSAAEAEAGKAEPQRRLARELADALQRENYVELRPVRKPSQASWLGLALFPLAAALADLVLGLSGAGPVPLLSLAAASIGLGLLSFLLLRSRIQLRDSSRADAALSRARDAWAGAGFGILGGEDAAGAIERLKGAEARAAELRRAADFLRSQVEAETAAVRKAAAEADAAASEEKSAGEGLYAWLAARGARSPEEYLASRKTDERKRAERSALESLAAAEASKRRLSGLEALRAALQEETREIRTKWDGIEGDALENSEILDAQLRKARDELAEANRRLSATSQRAGSAGSLADKGEAELQDDLADAEAAVARLEEACAEAALQRKAEELAHRAFLEMDRSGSDSFSGLSRKAAGYFSLAVGREAALSFGSLDFKEAKVPDASGEARPLEQLSLGTQDCFVLACRLALAEAVSDGEGGVLAFDEPFKNLDPLRLAGALKMVRLYRNLKGAQLFFFTKDAALVEALRSVFPSPESTVYDLAAPARPAPAGANKEKPQ